MGNTHAQAPDYGYRVIKVSPKSPGKKAGLVEFLDFITDIDVPNNQKDYADDYEAFHKLVQKNENQIITLTVYNVLYRKTRKISVVPHKNWEKADSLLGILVRYEDYLTAHERALKVVSVKPNSLGFSIGIEPQNDYILGTSNQLHFISPTETIGTEQIEPMELFFYNSKKNRVWSTLVTPLSNWEIGGYLGCEFAPEDSNNLPYLTDSPAFKESKLKNPFKNKLERKALQIIDNNISPVDHNEDRLTPYKLKPPNDMENEKMKIPLEDNHSAKDQRSNSFSLPIEKFDQRLKLLRCQSIRKGSCILVSKPFGEMDHTKRPQTLESLDNDTLLEKDKQIQFQNTKISNIQAQASMHTVDVDQVKINPIQKQSDTINHGFLSISSDENLISRKNENRIENSSSGTEYTYFSKKLGGTYVIRNTDLFNFTVENRI